MGKGLKIKMEINFRHSMNGSEHRCHYIVQALKPNYYAEIYGYAFSRKENKGLKW